jgi:hypothetical protein
MYNLLIKTLKKQNKCEAKQCNISTGAEIFFFFEYLDSPFGGLGRLIIEASRSHFLDTPHSVGLLWTRDQPVAENAEMLYPDKKYIS